MSGKLKHGHCVNGLSTTYRSWLNLKQRCSNKKNTKFVRYGGRGIKVCKRWLNSFENFLADMGEKPIGLTLDRVDNDGDYRPSNCRWATSKQQARNKTTNRFITYQGETLCLFDWARRTGIRWNTLQKRLEMGWSIHRTLTEPVRKRNHT